ncbi:MAG: hypothetical protein IT184_10575 [Acidobacteria bacterium]|nr:hypothetical protein [Acidobacteriota bacterium]
MRRVISRVVLAAALVLGGWSFGRAQSSYADFELEIDAPGPGRVNLVCIRGCTWGDLSRVGKPNSAYFSCDGPLARCPGVVDGRGVFLRHADGTDGRPAAQGAR